MIALIAFAVGLAVGRIYQEIRYVRLLRHGLPLLMRQPVANTKPPTNLKELG